MPLLKFRCEDCGRVFDALVRASAMETVVCEDCGGKVSRAYEGRCLFGSPGSDAGRGEPACSGECAGCSGCHHH